MTPVRKVAVIVGSLRKDSLNRKIAQAAIALAPPELQCEFVEIGQLPLYNQDHEADPPAVVRDFKAILQTMDAVLFVTPDFNRSVPGALKNAIDVGSRPYGASAWNAKPTAIISVTPGAFGAFGANHHLRQSLVFLNMPAMAQPEAYIGQAATLFDGQGVLVNDKTREFLQKFMAAFAVWIEHNAAR